MLLNPDKCHFLSLGFNKPFLDFSFENTTIKNAAEEKILGIVIDNNLNFKSHYLKDMCESQPKTQVHLQIFQNISFHQCTIYLLSLNMDVFFKGML